MPLPASIVSREDAVSCTEQHRLQARAAAFTFDEGSDRVAFSADAIGTQNTRALQHQHWFLVAGTERRQSGRDGARVPLWRRVPASVPSTDRSAAVGSSAAAARRSSRNAWKSDMRSGASEKPAAIG